MGRKGLLRSDALVIENDVRTKEVANDALLRCESPGIFEDVFGVGSQI